jgi:hypothetical protein
MNQIQTLLDQLQPYVSQLQALALLYSEILASLAAAGILGLIIGWMIKRSSAKRKLASSVATWEKRYETLEKTSHADAENLEEQLQTIAKEAKILQSTNRVLTESLKKNDTSIQKSRAEAIELNRQHAETQERLQRIILQKDREIVELGNRMHEVSGSQKPAGSTHIAPTIAGASNSQSHKYIDSELNHADTVAISSADVFTDSFDATVQMSIEELDNRVGDITTAGQSVNLDESLEDTADLSGIMDEDYEESTVALDDEALAFAQRSYPSGSTK